MEEGKKLSELRVVDLKGILEHRGLEKSGIKSVLLERLAQSVSDEGHDPETYIFKLDDADAGNKSELNDSTEESAHSANAEKTVDDSALENPESKSVVDETDVIKENSLENPPQSAGNDTSAEKLANQTLAETPNSNDVSAQGEKTEAEAEAEVTQDPDAEPETEKPMGAESNMEAAPVQGQESIHAEITEAKSTLENMEEKEPEVGQDGDTPITDTPGIEELSGEILGAVEAENAEESCELNLEKLPVVPEIDEAIPENDEAKPMDDSMGADPVLGFDEHEELGNIDAEDLGEADASSGFAMITDEEQLVVNVDESDTNLDYDLGEGAEEPERDAPTPTRDESVDMQSSSGTALNTVEGEEARPSPKSTDSKGDSKDLSKSQNLWVSGLSSTTRATDLKTVFSKHGKVVGAKVVTNANKPGAKCYGYVTMSSADEAAKCIQHLHRTDLHGKMISVEKAKSDPAAQARAAARAAESSNEPDKNTIIPTSKATSDSKTTDGEKREEASNRHRISLTSASARARAEREKSKQENETGDKSRADKSRTDKPEDPLERERRRLRVQEKRLRDDDYRRRQIFLKEKRALAEQHRRLRADQLRMDRERDKLRVDREKVKIEEMKLANLERERARFEATLLDLRQRVDREREELKRVETLRLEELRRSAAVKRPYDSANSRHEEPHWEAKRPAMSDRYVGSSARPAGDSRYHGEERNTDRRTIVRKDAPVSERTGAVSRTTDDRYYAGRARTSSAAATSERRDYSSSRPSDGRHTDRRSNGSSRGGGGWPDSSRASQPSSSARFSGSRSEGRTGTEGWPASTSNTPSLLGATPDLFGSASAHAASVMMNAAAIGRSSGGGGTSQSSRYSGGGYGGGSRRY